MIFLSHRNNWCDSVTEALYGSRTVPFSPWRVSLGGARAAACRLRVLRAAVAPAARRAALRLRKSAISATTHSIVTALTHEVMATP